MIKENLKDLTNTPFTRRAFILLLGKLMIAFIILIRLFTLQVFKGKDYKTLSDKNRIKLIPLQPRRGTIKGSCGNILAQDILGHKIYFYKQKGIANEESLNAILKELNLSSEKAQVIFKAVQKSPYLSPILLKDNLSWKTLTTIEGNLYNFPGVYIDKSYVRTYPLGKSLAHVLGYLGLPTQEEIDLYKLNRGIDTKIGKTGIEKLLNPVLIGSLGSRKVEVNANRIIVRTLTTDNGISGEDVALTINAELQKFVHSKLIDKSGCAAVMELETGKLLAACSTPGFDPNIFASNFDEKIWQSMVEDKHSPLINKLISKTYPPGSTWKIITALAILEAGIDPEEKILCKGHVMIGNRPFHCWKETGHGYVNFYDALPMSCNCYFYKMGIKVGIENIFKTATQLGMGAKTGFELPGEVVGVNPNKDWKWKTQKVAWTHGDTANAAIGQGFISVTPMQLLMMIARIVTGKIVRPILLKNQNYNSFDLISFQNQNLKLIQASLGNVFNSTKGTGFPARIHEKQFAMAGKTGTAQVISKNVQGNYSLKNPLGSHSLFVGYAPIDAPKYACVVLAENAGWGSVVAGPIGRDVLLFAQKNLST